MLLPYIRLAGWPVVPVLLLLFVILSHALAYLVGQLRKEFMPGQHPWRQPLSFLGVTASRLGLLATVAGSFQAFSCVAAGSPPQEMAGALARGLLCCFVGNLSALIASASSHLLDRLEEHHVNG